MSVEPYRDGATIWVPKFADNAQGDVGHGYVSLTDADPDYAKWDRYLKVKQERAGRTAAGKVGGRG